MTFIFLYISTKNKSEKLTILFKLCTNKNHSYKHNEQINDHNIDNDFTIILWKNMVLVDYIGIFLHVAILLATNCSFPIFWLGAFMTKVVPEARCVH